MLVDQSEHANFRPIRGQEIISDTHTDRQRINILSGPALRAAPAKTKMSKTLETKRTIQILTTSKNKDRLKNKDDPKKEDNP